MLKKLFETPKGASVSVEGRVDRCSVQYTANYGAFLILVEGDDRIFSIGPDQYLHPAIHLTQQGDVVFIKAREDLSQCSRDNMTVWTVTSIVNNTLEKRLGRVIPRWDSVPDESRTEKES